MRFFPSKSIAKVVYDAVLEKFVVPRGIFSMLLSGTNEHLMESEVMQESKF